MNHNKVIDLELGSDGVYSPVKKRKTSIRVTQSRKKLMISRENNNVVCDSPEQAILLGIDYGLDFLADVMGRLNRFSSIMK